MRPPPDRFAFPVSQGFPSARPLRAHVRQAKGQQEGHDRHDQWQIGEPRRIRQVSLTVAPGGTGKSSLATVEALAMATGRKLLHDEPWERVRVWLWNGEDPKDELQRRIAAACLHYGISREEIAGRLFVDSGRNSGIVIAKWSATALSSISWWSRR